MTAQHRKYWHRSLVQSGMRMTARASTWGGTAIDHWFHEYRSYVLCPTCMLSVTRNAIHKREEARAFDHTLMAHSAFAEAEQMTRSRDGVGGACLACQRRMACVATTAMSSGYVTSCKCDTDFSHTRNADTPPTATICFSTSAAPTAHACTHGG
jgi:hypothetical protein